MAVLLWYVFSINLTHWLPATEFVSFSTDPVEHFKHMILPVLTLAAGQIPVYVRLLRTDMTATLSEDYITMAKSKGISDRRILWRHALRPSSFTLVTILGVNIGALVGGALIVEQFFHLNGIGSFIIQSAFSRDYAVVMTLTALVAVVVVVVNFLVDLLYIALDPRIPTPAGAGVRRRAARCPTWKPGRSPPKSGSRCRWATSSTFPRCKCPR